MVSGHPAPADEPARVYWTEAGVACSARWHSERGAPAPARLVLADDSMTADAAYRLACTGTGLLWRGDFHNARQMLQALARRIDKVPDRKRRRAVGDKAAGLVSDAPAGGAMAERFHRHRQAQAQRARVLGMVLLSFDAQYRIGLRRAPDTREACTQAWGAAQSDAGNSVASLRDLLGLTGAHQWRLKGVEVPALGPAPDNRIHAHYGVFSPQRGEYVALVAAAVLPVTGQLPYVAFDIGTGTGVLAALLARRGVSRIVATDQDPRALACARENLDRLQCSAQVQLLQADLFPPGLASLVVCNPPWLPARPSAPIESAVYDPDSRMLRGFLAQLTAHLAPGGEGWLILSDLAEHLGLRTRAELLGLIGDAGLRVLGRGDIRPVHPKAADARDPLHAARAAELTSLWRLGALPL